MEHEEQFGHTRDSSEPPCDIVSTRPSDTPLPNECSIKIHTPVIVSIIVFSLSTNLAVIFL